MGLFSKDKTYLGIDLGASGVKIVEIKYGGVSGRSGILVNYGISAGVSLDGISKINDNNRELIIKAGQIIKSIIKETGMTGIDAVIGISNLAVFSAVINLFNVKEENIAAEVALEAKKISPFPVSEMILDWKKINIVKTEDKNSIRVLLTAVHKSVIQKYVAILKEAGLNAAGLETESFALVKSLLGKDQSPTMIIDMGSLATNIFVISGGLPLFQRNVRVGGAMISANLSQRLAINLADAEQFKYDLSFSAMGSAFDKLPPVISETVQPIINEIKYAFSLFEGNNNIIIEKVILSGGGALLVDFANHLSKILNKQVVVGDPFARIAYSTDIKLKLEEIGPRLAIAVGLAAKDLN